MSKSNGHANDDYVAAGFHRVPVDSNPPMINWGRLYREWTDDKKITYLEKLASSMNHAAHLIQTERNQLGDLCEKKEKQIKSLKIALDQNNSMIQGEITKMNADRQEYHKAIATLKHDLRSLEHGDHS